MSSPAGISASFTVTASSVDACLSTSPIASSTGTMGKELSRSRWRPSIALPSQLQLGCAILPQCNAELLCVVRRVAEVVVPHVCILQQPPLPMTERLLYVSERRFSIKSSIFRFSMDQRLCIGAGSTFKCGWVCSRPPQYQTTSVVPVACWHDDLRYTYKYYHVVEEDRNF